MTTSTMEDFLSEIIGGRPIPGGKLTYFQARLSGRIHQAMLNAFGRLEREKNFTRRDLARRIGRKPEQITRWFSYPGNLTLDTVSDIFLGMGYELEAIILMNFATGAKIRLPEQSHTGQHSTSVLLPGPSTHVYTYVSVPSTQVYSYVSSTQVYSDANVVSAESVSKGLHREQQKAEVTAFRSSARAESLNVTYPSLRDVA